MEKLLRQDDHHEPFMVRVVVDGSLALEAAASGTTFLLRGGCLWLNPVSVWVMEGAL